MPEAIIICCDCTEWMRNGDFTPNRFDAQKDAVGVICQTKIDQHPENSVGIIAMGKDQKAEVLVNCSRDTGRVLASAHKMRIEGTADILVAIQTAQLALKHRKNKKQTQRIILFVGSPIKVSVKLLVKAGKKLKKNNVAVDIVNFGEEEFNTAILEEFLKAVKSTDNSHLITVPSGTQQLLSDMLITSPIFAEQVGMNDLGLPADGSAGVGVPGGDNALAAGAGAANRGAFGGVDADMDREMAMAIRQSLEEERARQEALAREQQPQAQPQAQEQPQAQPSASVVASGANVNNNNPNNVGSAMHVDGDEEMGADEHVGDEEMGADDEELLQALQLSMQEGRDLADGDEPMQSTNVANTNANESQTEVSRVLDDDTYLSELLRGLPGVNENDIDVQDLIGDKEKDEDGDATMEDKNKKKDKSNEKDKNDENDT